MSERFDLDCQRGIDLAKRALPDGAPMDVGPLLVALYYSSPLRARFPQFQPFLNEPTPRRESPDSVPVAPGLKSVLERLGRQDRVITAERLFNALVASDEGRTFLRAQGMAEGALPQPGWRESEERRQAMETLSRFGRFLTALKTPPDWGYSEMEAPIQALIVTLSQMRRRNALVVGPPGTGKTALVYEFARRVTAGDPSIPAHLKDIDVFELSSGLLRADAGLADYESRLQTIKEALLRHRQLVLFVDEIHTVLQAATSGRHMWVEINERVFKDILSSEQTSCIACTTAEDYRNFIKPDGALDRRFELITLEPPTREVTCAILQARLPRVIEHYRPLAIPVELLERVVDLTDEHLRSRFQPDKSIRLLDRACALAVTDRPRAEALGEDHLLRALEATVGEFARAGRFTEAAVFAELRKKIQGQDECLRQIARAFVAGLGPWRRKGPRGVFLFAGPTGVGKTEAALQLARILGGGRDRLIRVDCNLLQGASQEEVGTITSTLLGAAPGYVGYVRGGGGLLNKVRDMPESVVLFDEFEKAHPALGELLLRILDDGVCEDSVGNTLDFRRCFIVLTTNAGSTYEEGRLGFVLGRPTPTADETNVLKALSELTELGPEFFGRIDYKIVFRGLDQGAIELILAAELDELRDTLAERGMRLSWMDDVPEHLLSHWQERYGVRHLTAILRNRIIERLNIADAEGSLDGVEEVELRVFRDSAASDAIDTTGLATHERQGTKFLISVA